MTKLAQKSKVAELVLQDKSWYAKVVEAVYA
jgi:hypothetical protein